MTLFESFEEAVRQRCDKASEDEKAAAAVACLGSLLNRSPCRKDFLAANASQAIQERASMKMSQVAVLLKDFGCDGKLLGGRSLPASTYNAPRPKRRGSLYSGLLQVDHDARDQGG